MYFTLQLKSILCVRCLLGEIRITEEDALDLNKVICNLNQFKLKVSFEGKIEQIYQKY